MKNKNKITFIAVAVLVLAAVVLLAYPNFKSGPSNLGPFASCLKARGVVFYGAFWCPHCAAQKKLFGTAVGALPYVECSTPDGNGQTQVCIDKGIKSYPTWKFPDGTEALGETSLQTLAGKSGCALPVATN